jgi:hypothetical protein
LRDLNASCRPSISAWAKVTYVALFLYKWHFTNSIKLEENINQHYTRMRLTVLSQCNL